ncbi:hypothetical protein [Halobacterium wangiae]|uniref:hypothetical protein n=1 Tax=Halobacterium wangiae TaxID=2902623 RepID=UPI001E3F7FC7|nr:hypothetical protein [Halobacterium wangiae]
MSDDDCCGGDDTPVAGDDDIAEGDDPGHALPEADLNYPTLSFDEGAVAEDGSFDLSREVDYDEMIAWAEDLAGALASHDLAVSAPEGYVSFGVGPKEVDVSFDADENHRGELELTFRLSAKAMLVDDEDSELVGSRGDRGFVPLSMLEGDREHYRCYNWIDDPENPD